MKKNSAASNLANKHRSNHFFLFFGRVAGGGGWFMLLLWLASAIIFHNDAANYHLNKVLYIFFSFNLLFGL